MKKAERQMIEIDEGLGQLKTDQQYNFYIFFRVHFLYTTTIICF